MSYRVQDLLPGDVLLMTRSLRDGLPARLLDVLIAWSEGNPFVHACLVGDGHLVDPTWPRVEHGPLERYMRNGWAFRVRAAPMQRQAALSWAEDHVGTPYGIEELLADAARLDLHVVLPSWYHWRAGRWTCSGFVTRAYLEAGVALTHAPLPSPADLSYSPALVGARPWRLAARSSASSPRRHAG